jgi:hypothetical protein
MHILRTHSHEEAPLYSVSGEKYHHPTNYANTLLLFEIHVYGITTIPVKTTTTITSSNPHRILLIHHGTIPHHTPPLLTLTPLLPYPLAAPFFTETVTPPQLMQYRALFTQTLHLLISAWPWPSCTTPSSTSLPSSVHRKRERLIPCAGRIIRTCDLETRREYWELVCRVAL